MLIDVLVIEADGSQHVEQREVPEDYYGTEQKSGKKDEAGRNEEK